MINFNKHNEEVKQVWDAYRQGKPVRVPMVLGMNPRMILLDKRYNRKKITFKRYFENPDIMWDINLEFAYWTKFNLPRDEIMGLPKNGWVSNVHFQNCYDAAWFGAKIQYYDNQCPDTIPMLNNDNKNLLFDKGIPDTFNNEITKRNMDYYSYFKKKSQTFMFHNLPIVSITPAGLGTDGIFTAAANLRGATEICTDIYEDPEYVKKLLDYITSALIMRIKSWRKLMNHDMKPPTLSFADDSIQLISNQVYKEFVLPYHKRFFKELAGKGPHSIHLCGNTAHQFKTLVDELNIKTFDTGFPIDFTKLRNELGDDVTIQGGPNIVILLTGTVEEVENETKRILQSGIMRGGKFMLREGNNLAPCTPSENVEAMYRTVKKYGCYT